MFPFCVVDAELCSLGRIFPAKCKKTHKVVNTKCVISGITNHGLLLFSQCAHHGNTKFVSASNRMNALLKKKIKSWENHLIMNFDLCFSTFYCYTYH